LVDVSLSVRLGIKSHAVVEMGRRDLFVSHVSELTGTATVMLQHNMAIGVTTLASDLLYSARKFMFIVQQSLPQDQLDPKVPS
jgi:hypothetical protein